MCISEYDLQRDNFVERILRSARGTFETYTVYLGHRFGFYTALADGGGMTVAQLAERTGTHPRYVREWLEQQASGGIIGVDDPGKATSDRRFHLPPAHAEILAAPESLDCLAPMVPICAKARPACTGPCS